jgi:hypothetical protein
VARRKSSRSTRKAFRARNYILQIALQMGCSPLGEPIVKTLSFVIAAVATIAVASSASAMDKPMKHHMMKKHHMMMHHHKKMMMKKDEMKKDGM